MNQALTEILRLAERRAHARRLATLDGLDLGDERTMARSGAEPCLPRGQERAGLRPAPTVRARLEPLQMDGLVATCGVVDLEVGYAAQTAAVHRDIRRERAALPRPVMNDEVFARAVKVQGERAERSQHVGLAQFVGDAVYANADRAGAGAAAAASSAVARSRPA